MAQQIVERAGRDRHNYARTGRMALYGGGRLHPTLFPNTRNTHTLVQDNE